MPDMEDSFGILILYTYFVILFCSNEIFRSLITLLPLMEYSL